MKTLKDLISPLLMITVHEDKYHISLRSFKIHPFACPETSIRTATAHGVRDSPILTEQDIDKIILDHLKILNK